MYINQSNWIAPYQTHIYTLTRIMVDRGNKIQLTFMVAGSGWNHNVLYMSYTHSDDKHYSIFLRNDMLACFFFFFSVRIHHCTRSYIITYNHWHGFVLIAVRFPLCIHWKMFWSTNTIFYTHSFSNHVSLIFFILCTPAIGWSYQTVNQAYTHYTLRYICALNYFKQSHFIAIRTCTLAIIGGRNVWVVAIHCFW